MGYKILGYAVWNVGKIVVRRKARGAASGRNAAIAGVVGAAVVGLVIAGNRGGD